jgi:DNA-binding CsgD family transcriptional regulator
MARPSDLTGEVVEAAEASDDLDLARKRREASAASARRVEALTLRLAGLSYEQIAERLHISREGAQDMVNRSLARAENLAAEEMRELEGSRLDRAQAAIWTQVLEGDVKAVQAFLQISARRARLFGLDAPTKLNISVSVRAEMEQALNALEQVVLGEVIHDAAAAAHQPAAIESG